MTESHVGAGPSTGGDGYSRDALLAWLREAALARLIHPATARSRRKAAEVLFPTCRPEGIEDHPRLNLQDLRARVADLPRGLLRPEVADLYLERLRSALRNFLSKLDLAYLPTNGEPAAMCDLPHRVGSRLMRCLFYRHRMPIGFLAGCCALWRIVVLRQ